MAFSKITTRGMSGDTLEAGDIAPNAIGASELADNAVDTAAIAANAVTNAKIPDDLIQVKPHIKPGILKPAYRGLLAGNTTGRTFVDSGGTGHAIISSGKARVSHTAGVKKIGNTSLRFDGYDGDFLTIADHADFDVGTGDFTWEMWVNIDGYQTNYTTIINDDAHKFRITIGPDSSTAPKFSVYGPWGTHLTTTTTLSLNTWHHFAYVRQSSTVRLYVNGVQEATRASTTDDLDPTGIRIGQYYNTTLFFKGNLDEIRFSNNARYVDGTTFTPSTSAFSSDGNTKLLIHSNESLAHSGAYGTAQSDGHSYYYTDIEGSREINDPRIGAHFGGQRHKVKSKQKLHQESITQTAEVYTIDGKEWFRVSCPKGKFVPINNADGQRINTDSTEAFVEVVAYFNHFNVIHRPKANAEWRYSLDGATEVGTSYGAATNTSPLHSRYYDTGSLVNIPISTTLGIHTIKLRQHNTDLDFFGIEFLAQDTGTDARRSQINIPAQNVVSYGKKFSIGSDTLTNSVHPHYDPFNGWSGAKTASQLAEVIDTATSLGMDNWKAGTSNYYRPWNGGRVVKWVASDGTIKTSVTMMPPNAQNFGGDASNAVTNTEVQNGTNGETINFSTGTIDNSLSEEAKTFHWREFGNGSANGLDGANYADFSCVQNSEDDLAYNMDDGLTTMVAEDAGAPNGEDFVNLYVGGSDDLYITWIGTGIGMFRDARSTLMGIEDGIYGQNLPYGTHILKLKRSSPYDMWIDGIQAPNAPLVAGDYIGGKDITFYQPKMPNVPKDACIIADYMLMADYVVNTTATVGAISKGVRRSAGVRDHFYNCGGAMSVVDTAALAKPFIFSGPASHASNTMPVTLPYFGTSFTSYAHDQSQTHTFTLDGSAVTPTEVDNDGVGQDMFYHTVSTLGLHTKVHTVPAGGYRFQGTDVATPIHTSSHYQTFETPCLNELVGGDRNMEQTNLLVTPDGKTWEDITRDTSYLGNLKLQIARNSGDSSGEDDFNCNLWRGGMNTSTYMVQKDFAQAFNKIYCLVDGEYKLTFNATVKSGGTTGSAYIQINGTTQQIKEHCSGNSQRGSNNILFIGTLNRGDVIKLRGSNLEGSHGNYWCYLQIERLN